MMHLRETQHAVQVCDGVCLAGGCQRRLCAHTCPRAQNGNSSSSTVYFYLLWFLFCLTCLQVDYHKPPDGTLPRRPPRPHPAGLCFSPLPPEIFTRLWNRRRSSRVETGGG